MKREFKNIFLTMMLVTASAAPALAGENAVKASANNTANISVTLTGVKDVEGFITAGLFNSEAGYKGGKGFRGVNADVKAETVTFTYSNLPMGEYAIKLFHDVNGDGKMGTNLFGIPTEPYAFSNNAIGKMGPAKWADAKFSITNGDNTHAIKLN